jgi:hypothetical protein
MDVGGRSIPSPSPKSKARQPESESKTPEFESKTRSARPRHDG